MRSEQDDWTIVLFATRGLGSFVENALIGIRRCGIDPGIVHVILPRNAAPELLLIVDRYGATPRILEEFLAECPIRMPDEYLNYGTYGFNRLMRHRFPVLRRFLERGRRLVYADVDVAWLRNPLPYLASVLETFPWACQTESYAAFPAPFCVGFFAVRPDSTCFDLIDRHAARMQREDSDFKLTMQALFQQVVSETPPHLVKIFPLPEGLFPNGLLYRVLHEAEEDPVAMAGALQPFIFHANWTVGLDSKHRLLRHCGCWWAGEGAHVRSDSP